MCRRTDLAVWHLRTDSAAGAAHRRRSHCGCGPGRGDIEPAGRLVTTFPTEDGASPAWSVMPVNGEVRYSEGPFIAYRGYAAGKAPPPAFWFGHGLGYSSWAYSNAEVAQMEPSPAV